MIKFWPAWKYCSKGMLLLASAVVAGQCLFYDQ